MVKVNSTGYLSELQRVGKLKGRIEKALIPKIWMAQYNTDGYNTAEINIQIQRISLPLECAGKRYKIKIEEVE